MLDLLLAPLSYTGYLVIAPWAALFPAMALFALGWRFRSYVCHVAAGCWLLWQGAEEGLAAATAVDFSR